MLKFCRGAVYPKTQQFYSGRKKYEKTQNYCIFAVDCKHLSVRKLLDHQFELEEDFLTGFVSKFLKGEIFKEEVTPFNKYEIEVILPLIENNLNNDDGKDLLTTILLTEFVYNIMNKHKKKSGLPMAAPAIKRFITFSFCRGDHRSPVFFMAGRRGRRPLRNVCPLSGLR